MKNRLKIFFFSIILFPSLLFSQTVEDIAIVRVDSVRYLTEDLIQFDLNLLKIDERWDAWGNATIQIGFDDPDFQINTNAVEITYVDGSTEIEDLQTGLAGNYLFKEDYYITPRVLNDRISITISGPQSYDYCEPFQMDEEKRIGTFQIQSKTGSIPPKLKFIEPIKYYQAIAYKTGEDVLKRGKLWYKPDDNIEMDDGYSTRVIYEIDHRQPEMVLDTFYAEYRGSLKAELIWITESEPRHKGFILKRKMIPFGSLDIDEGEFEVTVGRWDGESPEESILQWKIENMSGAEYHFKYDALEYWDEVYAYQLLYENVVGEVYPLDTCILQVPKVVISKAKAQPNPFAEETTVDYILEEDVILDCTVYDVEGKEVEKPIDNEKMPEGEHQITFRADVYAPQGLYDIIFIAKPQDKSLPAKIARAVLKVQLIR